MTSEPKHVSLFNTTQLNPRFIPLTSGHAVLLSPEGTRSKTGQLGVPFKKGAFHITEGEEVNLMAIRGGYELWGRRVTPVPGGERKNYLCHEMIVAAHEEVSLIRRFAPFCLILRLSSAGLGISFKKVQFGEDREENRIMCEREMAALMSVDDVDDVKLGIAGGYFLGLVSWAVWRVMIGLAFGEVTLYGWTKAFAGVMVLGVLVAETLYRLAKARGRHAASS